MSTNGTVGDCLGQLVIGEVQPPTLQGVVQTSSHSMHSSVRVFGWEVGSAIVVA